MHEYARSLAHTHVRTCILLLLQAEMVLGTSADHLAELRAKDEAAYKAHLAGAQWCEWRMTVQTKGQEYKGERRLRHQVCVVYDAASEKGPSQHAGVSCILTCCHLDSESGLSELASYTCSGYVGSDDKTGHLSPWARSASTILPLPDLFCSPPLSLCAFALRPVHFAEDGHRLLEAIHSYAL
eukprot:1038973-Pelagomonas_calceolata.AAC.4